MSRQSLTFPSVRWMSGAWPTPTAPWLLRTLTASFVAILAAGVSDVPAQVGVQVLPSESHISIDGRSNVNSFTCVSKDVKGSGEIARTAQTSGVLGEVAIPVEAFDCKNERMSKDLFDALKGNEHPFITFRLEGVHVVEKRQFEIAAAPDLTRSDEESDSQVLWKSASGSRERRRWAFTTIR